jgi:nitrous oxidase accessory protein
MASAVSIGHDAAPAAAPAAGGAGAGHGAHPAGHAAAAPQPARVAPASGAVAQNRWQAEGRGNYWSDYAGYDADGDGVGDRPYRPVSAFESLRDHHPAVDLFRFTPAQQIVDAAGRLFPLVKPEVLIEDAAPLMAPPTPLPQAGSGRGLLALSALLLLAAAGPAVWLTSGRRVRRAVRLARSGRRTGEGVS